MLKSCWLIFSHIKALSFSVSLFPECCAPQPESAQVFCSRWEREGGRVDCGWSWIPKEETTKDDRVRVHTHTVMYMYTHTHRQSCTCTHTHTYSHIHVHTHTYSHIHVHTLTYSHIHVDTHTSSHAQIWVEWDVSVSLWVLALWLPKWTLCYYEEANSAIIEKNRGLLAYRVRTMWVYACVSVCVCQCVCAHVFFPVCRHH